MLLDMVIARKYNVHSKKGENMSDLPAIRGSYPKPSSSLRVNAHCYEIFAMLTSGWHPESVTDVIQRRYGEQLSVDEVARYLQEIPPWYFYHEPEEEQKPRIMDTLGEMHRAVADYGIRLRRIMAVEDEGDAASVSQTLSQIRQFFNLLERLTRLEADVGLNRYTDTSGGMSFPAESLTIEEITTKRITAARESPKS